MKKGEIRPWMSAFVREGRNGGQEGNDALVVLH